jgi:predicted metal-dependent hydrolase
MTTLPLLYIGAGEPPPLPTATWHTHAALNGLIDVVVRVQPALIVLAHPTPAWQPYAQALKTNSATRRIPLLLIAEVDAATAQLHGADEVVTPRRWQTEAAALVEALARVPDPALLAELDCQCAEPLPPRAVEGIARFNAGEYYQQHDLFEAQWVEEAGPVRDLYRAILQVGVAYYQITRGNYRGALKMLHKSVQWLMLLPDVCQGVDVRQLREDSFRVRAELERLGPSRLHEFDRGLLRPVQVRSMNEPL